VDNVHSVIVVGVDGSAAAARAIDWALDEARTHGDHVVLVHAWQHPVVTMRSIQAEPWPGVHHLDIEKVAAEALDAVTQAARKRAPDVPIDFRLVEGHPSKVLVDASSVARLLVVGSRGLGGFKGLLLGSVSSACAHGARCPLVVIPNPAAA
jgi:nucleotide-binding universal stress UspA family protein